jgi:hypothetical protein
MNARIFYKNESYSLEICVSRKAFKRKEMLFTERNVQFLGIQHETDNKYLIFRRNNPSKGVSTEFQINGDLIKNVEPF